MYNKLILIWGAYLIVNLIATPIVLWMVIPKGLPRRIYLSVYFVGIAAAIFANLKMNNYI